MYKVFESAMSTSFDLSEMLEKINRHHVLGNLTDDDRDKMESLARSKADPSGSLDVMAKLQELDARITALEKGGSTATPGNGVTGSTEAAQEYVPGKWYRAGDRVAYSGRVYVCTAPDGQVCVWSPAEYPDYWEVAV